MRVREFETHGHDPNPPDMWRKAKVEPVVYIECDFGPGARRTFGSGFMMGQWDWSVFTAAHTFVSEDDPGLPPRGVQIRFWFPDPVQSHKLDIWATRVAVPDDVLPTDIGVIRLPWKRPALKRPMPRGMYSDRAGGFEGRIDWCEADAGPSWSDCRVRYEDPWLVWHGTSNDGMSGGPLLFEGYAIGVHRGRRNFDGIEMPVATPLDTPLVPKLIAAAAGRD